ncbi:MAG: EAL domain-containing protein [Nitrosomonadales bacterium]|nr:EAL domain-containing protein [Nitrosomonadales bacterium]
MAAYRWTDLPRLAGMALLYALLAKIALSLFSANGSVSIVWPPSGLALAALLIGGRKFWPGIFAGALAANIMADSSVWTSAFIAAGNTMEALAGFWLLTRTGDFDRKLTRPRDYLLMILAGAASAAVAAANGVAALLLSGFLTPQTAGINLLHWWQGDFLGIALLTPMILVWRKAPAGRLNPKRLAESMACFGLAFLLGQVIFLGWFNGFTGPMPPLLLFLFLAWAAMRFGRRGAMLIIGMAAAQGLWGEALGAGFFAGFLKAHTGNSSLLNFWLFLLVLSVVGITLALAIRSRELARLGADAGKARLDEAQRLAQVGSWDLDLAGGNLLWSDEIFRIFEIDKAKFGATYEAFLNTIHPDDRELVNKAYTTSVANRTPYEIAHRLLMRDGRIKWVNERCETYYDHDGKPCRSAGTVQDITERKKAEEALQLASMVYENSSEAILVTDAGNRIIAVNPAFEKMTGYTADDVHGKNPNLFNSGRHEKAFFQAMWHALNTVGHWSGEVWDKRKNGEIYPKLLTVNTIKNEEGAVIRYVALFTDITEMKQYEEMVWKQANFDALTRLPNRRMFHDRMEQEARKSHRTGLPVALMLIDLDRFKEVNDTLGHDQGDLLLIEAARRIGSCVRESDTVARLGGDEFVVILPELDDTTSVERIAQDIIGKLTDPFALGAQNAYISASIGISLYPDDTTDLEVLFRNADQAMYVAKTAGRSRFSYFTPALQEEAQKRLHLVNDLRAALAGGQFRVVYQPIVELASGQIYKAEALLRWQHPARGTVSPLDFIPLAEETGLIVPIGNWVFGQAVQQARQWRDAYHESFQVSVNKSPAQFHNEDSAHPAWPVYLQQQGMPGQCVAIEITEGLLLNAESSVNDKLLDYRDAGIQVAIDDFGTGYSSLSYLKKFHIDYLKIDQSFVRDLEADANDLVLCEAIIVMAHKLWLKVIAEGVETEAQRDLLIMAGCDYGQGYLFSRPLPPEGLDALLKAGWRPET